MEAFAKDFVALLQYLLPGFVAAWIFYSFTSFPKPSQFERVVQALIFTILIQAIVFITKKIFLFLGARTKWSLFDNWNNHWDIICSIGFGMLLGIIFSYYTNNDKIHKKLRDWGITRESSYPSEWFGAFLTNVTYVVLHFEDERRLYGWPIEWPSEPGNGYIVLEQASWLDGEEECPITSVKSIMVNTKDIKWVEFLEKTWEKENGEKRVKSKAPIKIGGE